MVIKERSWAHSFKVLVILLSVLIIVLTFNQFIYKGKISGEAIKDSTQDIPEVFVLTPLENPSANFPQPPATYVSYDYYLFDKNVLTSEESFNFYVDKNIPIYKNRGYYKDGKYYFTSENAVFLAQEQNLFGEVHLEHFTYSIYSLSNKDHSDYGENIIPVLIVKQDDRLIPPDFVVTEDFEENQIEDSETNIFRRFIGWLRGTGESKKDGETLPLGSDDGRIDVMMVYTPAFRQIYGFSPDEVGLLMEFMVLNINSYYENSGLTQRLNLVHVSEVGYTEICSDMGQDLSNLKNGAGALGVVHSWRNQFGADMVQLIIRPDCNHGGIAYLLTNPEGDEERAFSVVSYFNSGLVAHEFGHNEGMCHAPGDGGGCYSGGLFSYSKGHRFGGQDENNYRTIMAYPPGGRIPYFSNPNVEFLGEPTGTVDRNNALTLINSAELIRNYRPCVDGCIFPPSNVYAEEGVHPNKIRISWGSHPSQETYTIYRSTHPELVGMPGTELVTGLTENFYYDEYIINQRHYYYGVRAYGGGEESQLSEVVLGYSAPDLDCSVSNEDNTLFYTVVDGTNGDWGTITMLGAGTSTTCAKLSPMFSRDNPARACNGENRVLWVAPQDSGVLFNHPEGFFVPPNGILLISDSFNHVIRKFDTNGEVTTIAGEPEQPGSNDGSSGQAHFNNPNDLVSTSTGKYIVDRVNNKIRKLSDGQVTTFAGTGTFGVVDGPLDQARFAHPSAIAVDSGGVFYVADRMGHTIRKITSTEVTTIAGQASTPGFNDGPGNQALFNQPEDLAVFGNTLYVAERYNHRIRAVDLIGNAVTGTEYDVSTVAGSGNYGYVDGYALKEAEFRQPTAIAVHPSGDIYIADTLNYRIRKLSNGIVSTVAGSGEQGYLDGPALSAQFGSPSDIEFNPTGDILYIADSGNSCIRQYALYADIVETRLGECEVPGHQDSGPSDEPTSNALAWNPEENGDGLPAGRQEICYEGVSCVYDSAGDGCISLSEESPQPYECVAGVSSSYAGFVTSCDSTLPQPYQLCCTFA